MKLFLEINHYWNLFACRITKQIWVFFVSPVLWSRWIKILYLFKIFVGQLKRFLDFLQIFQSVLFEVGTLVGSKIWGSYTFLFGHVFNQYLNEHVRKRTQTILHKYCKKKAKGKRDLKAKETTNQTTKLYCEITGHNR